MLKNLKNRLNENKGFSLVELIVVIAIMVILIALLVPNVVGYISKAQDSANLSAAKSIYNALNTAVIDHKAQTGGYPSPASLAADMNSQYSANKAEALAVVPKGTAVAVGYDGAGQVWAVAVGSDEGALSTSSSKNIQMYSPIYSGNVYSASASGSGLTATLPVNLTCSGNGANSWTGTASGSSLNF